MFICVYDVNYIKTQFNHSKFCNFINSWQMLKTTIELRKRFYFHKINKKNGKKTRNELFCSFAGMTLLTLGSKLCNFVTSWELIKTQKNFVQSSFFIKSLKSCYKNVVSFWPENNFGAKLHPMAKTKGIHKYCEASYCGYFQNL